MWIKPARVDYAGWLSTIPTPSTWLACTDPARNPNGTPGDLPTGSTFTRFTIQAVSSLPIARFRPTSAALPNGNRFWPSFQRKHTGFAKPMDQSGLELMTHRMFARQQGDSTPFTFASRCAHWAARCWRKRGLPARSWWKQTTGDDLEAPLSTIQQGAL